VSRGTSRQEGDLVTERIVITGRSGAGVSTTAVNLSAALAEQGYRVAHIGYDRRRISTGLLRGSAPLQVACGEACKDGCDDPKPQCALGFGGILCIECGVEGEADIAPQFAGAGCRELMARFRPDFVVHDVAGEPDTVLPFLRSENEPARVLVVASADFAALTTLNQFQATVAGAAEPSRRFGGVVANNISGPFFESLVEDFTREAGAKVFASVPRSLLVSAGAYGGQTVIESAPQSHISSVYRKLARLVALDLPVGTPRSLDGPAFSVWLQKWSDITEELECGLVRDGAAI
jgi:nitrogenase iron protein NifH